MLSTVTSSYMAGHRIAPSGVGPAPAPTDQVLFTNFDDPACWSGTGRFFEDLSPQNNDTEYNGGAIVNSRPFVTFPGPVYWNMNVISFSGNGAENGTLYRTRSSLLSPNIQTTAALTTTGQTIVFWIYLLNAGDGSTTPYTLASRTTLPPTQSPSSGWWATLSELNDTITLNVRVNSTTFSTTSSIGINQSEWYMIALVPACGGSANPFVLTIFPPGGTPSVSQSSTNTSYGNVAPSAALVWGNPRTYQNYHQVFDRRVGLAELTGLYNSQKGFFRLT